MTRLSKQRWEPSSVKMVLVDQGCPFDPSLAAGWLEHLCDLLTFLTDKEFIWGGIVSEEGDEYGTIYHKFIPTGEGKFWARAWRKPDLATDITHGICLYRVDKMPLPEHFAGMCLHETKHILGVEHFNTHNSIMNNQPYHGHHYQASPMAADYRTFELLFGRPPIPRWSCAYDYGDLGQEQCIIHIPTIEWRTGAFAAIWLEGRQDNGQWLLEAPSYAIQHHSGYVGRPVASLSNDVLNIPLRYKGSTVEIVAPLRQFSGPSSKVRFEVTEINPLHIHSAFDWVK